MSATAQTTARRAGLPRPLRAIAVHPEAIAVGSLALATLLLAGLTWATWGDMRLDTGYDLVAGQRVAGGSLPYVDYAYSYGPLGPFVLGAAFALGSPTFGVAAAIGLVLSLAIVALTYAVARRVAPPAGAAAAGLLAATVAFSNSDISFVMPHTLSASLGYALALGAVLLLTSSAVPGARRRALVAAGAMLGLVALTRHDLTLACFMAATAWLAMRAWRAGAAGRRAALIDALAVAGPALAIPLAVYGAFAADVGLHALIHQNLLDDGLMRDTVRPVYDKLAPFTLGSFAGLLGHLALAAAGAGALLLAGAALLRGGVARTAALAAIALAAIATLALLAGRPDTVRHYLQYAYAWIPAGAALCAAGIVWAVRGGRLDWGASTQTGLVASVVVLGLSAGSYAEFWPYPNPSFPQDTGYALPFVAILLAWLLCRALPALAARRAGAGSAGAPWRALGIAALAGLGLVSAGLVVHDARLETLRVHGPGGTMTALAGDSAYPAALAAIERTTRPGEPILLAPQLTSLYILSGRENPLRQISLLPGSLDGARDERAAIARMGAVRLAIVDRTPLARYRTGSFGTAYDRRIGAWLRLDFDRVETLRGSGPGSPTLDVWRRRST